MSNITLPRAEAEQIRQALVSGKRLYAALAALDAALAEPEHIHTCGPDCQKPLCVNRRREIAAAVEAEREACEKECAEIAERFGGTARDCAEAIRVRGGGRMNQIIPRP
jgi:hypothetical protein